MTRKCLDLTASGGSVYIICIVNTHATIFAIRALERENMKTEDKRNRDVNKNQRRVGWTCDFASKSAWNITGVQEPIRVWHFYWFTNVLHCVGGEIHQVTKRSAVTVAVVNSVSLFPCQREQTCFERTLRRMGRSVVRKDAGDTRHCLRETRDSRRLGGVGSSSVSLPLKARKDHMGLMDGSAPDWPSLSYGSSTAGEDVKPSSHPSHT